MTVQAVAPVCVRCGAPMYAVGDDPGAWACASCKTATVPTLADLVLAAVGAADQGEEAPNWREAAKWSAALKSGGDAALAFVRWLDFEQGIVLASLGPGGCEKCLLADDGGVEECPVKGKHPPSCVPMEVQPEVLLARMMGVDLVLVEEQRKALATWWRSLVEEQRKALATWWMARG